MDYDHSHTRSSSQESPMTDITTPEVSESGDIWASDDNNESSRGAGTDASQNEMLSDLPSVKRQHMTDGYREGLSIGKAQVMQKGFDAGYPIGVAIAMRAGRVLGCIEGIVAAKDVSDEIKTAARKTLDRARQELAITTLLKDMNDQDIMSFVEVPVRVHDVLLRWELAVLSSSTSNEGEQASKTEIMVHLRGIDINAVSQIDAKRLPEYSTARAFDALGAVTACYIPIYPGAQLWFEYSVDGPYPPNAAYFFKMFVNGQVASAWDCTAKHDYHGKAVYNLHTVESNVPGERVVVQKSLAFAGTGGNRSPDVEDDCIEIRVHRIEHRRRIHDLPVDSPLSRKSQSLSALKIVDHGPTELGRPARRYQYQLIDPQDEPYATFRLYCRSYEYLNRHQILELRSSSSSVSQATFSSQYFDTETSPERESYTKPDSSLVSPATPNREVPCNYTRHNDSNVSRRSSRSPDRTKSPHNDSRLAIKDSIEELPSAVPRSPVSPKRLTFCGDKDVPPSPTRPSNSLQPEALRIHKRLSPRNLVKTYKYPTLNVNHDPRHTQILNNPHATTKTSSIAQVSTGSPKRSLLQRHKPSHLKLDLDQGQNHKDSLSQSHPRPLSPFTRSGFLRRLTSDSSLTALPSLNTPASKDSHVGAAFQDEAEQGIRGLSIRNIKTQNEMASRHSSDGLRTTRLHRGGGLFNSFLGRRIEKRSAT